MLRLLIEKRLDLDLLQLIDQVADSLPAAGEGDWRAGVYDYIMERLRAYYLEEGSSGAITAEMFDAVLANRPGSPLDFDARIRALQQFLQLDDAPSLAAANKRIANILRKSDSAAYRRRQFGLADGTGREGPVRSGPRDGESHGSTDRAAGSTRPH